MLQIKCSCGRIAEVRHRKNGQKLAFKHCVNGCGGIVSAKKAAEIEAQAVENIGVKGDFFNAEASKPVESEQSKEQDKEQVDFKPIAEDMPEVLESSTEVENEEIESESPKQGKALKIIGSISAIGLLCGGFYQLAKLRG